MARSKQATPTRREESSEYISKHDRVSDRRASAAKNMTGPAKQDAGAGAERVAPRRDAGLATLVIDVAGIYASL